jgi:hypothetical protein
VLRAPLDTAANQSWLLTKASMERTMHVEPARVIQASTPISSAADIVYPTYDWANIHTPYT